MALGPIGDLRANQRAGSKLLIEWDPAKDDINRRERNISLRRAGEFDLADAYVFEDNREDYGEERLVAFGRIDGVIYAMVYTVRGPFTRVISLRRAEKHERTVYNSRHG